MNPSPWMQVWTIRFIWKWVIGQDESKIFCTRWSSTASPKMAHHRCCKCNRLCVRWFAFTANLQVSSNHIRQLFCYQNLNLSFFFSKKDLIYKILILKNHEASQTQKFPSKFVGARLVPNKHGLVSLLGQFAHGCPPSFIKSVHKVNIWPLILNNEIIVIFTLLAKLC